MESIEDIKINLHNVTWQKISHDGAIDMRNKLFNHLILHNSQNKIEDLDNILNFARTHDLFGNLSEKNKSGKVSS